MLVWIYWKNREVFIEKFKSFFKLGENYVEQASKFIRIYLESENIEKLKNMYISLGSKLEGCYIFPWCFSNRYIWKSNFDSVATWCLDSQGVRGTMLQYPELLKRHYLLINFYFQKSNLSTWHYLLTRLLNVFYKKFIISSKELTKYGICLSI